MPVSIVHTFAPGDSPVPHFREEGNDNLISRAVLCSNYVGTKNCSTPQASFPRKRESPDPKHKAVIKIFLLLITLLISVFVSCGNKSQEKKFFDVPGYFRGEIEELKKSNFIVSKRSVYNNDASVQHVKANEMNWEKEFAVFLESDINKPVYYANMHEDDSGNCWTYSKKLSIKKVNIGYGMNEDGSPNHKIEHISIQIAKSNLISNTTITASYEKESRYFIEGEQSIRQLDERNTFSVEGHFN